VVTIGPRDQVPDLQNDGLVTGEAEPGPAPGRDVWVDFPDLQKDGVVALPGGTPPVEDRVNGHRNGGLEPQRWCVGCGQPGNAERGPLHTILGYPLHDDCTVPVQARAGPAGEAVA
jgi:hypothetical protein